MEVTFIAANPLKQKRGVWFFGCFFTSLKLEEKREAAESDGISRDSLEMFPRIKPGDVCDWLAINLGSS